MSQSSLSPGSRLGHYEIAELIGEGGMGQVYRAHDTKLHRDVALKVLPPDTASDPERRQRFEREARAVAALNHPNIVTIHSATRSSHQTHTRSTASSTTCNLTLSSRNLNSAYCADCS
jgi:serine/threonine protein kinase